MKKVISFKHILIISFFSFLVTIYLAFPLIKYGANGVFFKLDPDAHYIGNVISYIKSHQISYINHPATPTIMAYVYALTPLRFYTKFVANTNFVDWYILNIDVVYLYLRVLHSVIFDIGLFIFSLSVYRVSRSLFLSLFSVLSLFTFGFFTDMALHIRSETTSFLMISIWLFIFAGFLRSKSAVAILVMALISGLAIANKFTNIFYFIGTICLIPSIKGYLGGKKILILVLNLFLALTSFIVFTFPIRTKYNQVIQFVFHLFPQSGVSSDINSLFNLSIYLQGLSFLFQKETVSSIIVVLTGVLLIYLFFKKKSVIPSPIFILGFNLLIGMLVTARYPLNYYQTTYFTGIIYIMYFLLAKIKNFPRYLFLVPAFFASVRLINYYPTVFSEINQSIALDQFVYAHPSSKGTIWERGDSRDFALLWGNSWGGASYSQDLARLRPDLLFEIYFWENYLGNKENIFKICWDKFYMQKNYLEVFKEKYKNNKFTYLKIPKTDNMYVVERTDCEI